ncbi:MAG TPA: glycosyltransferase family 4 protein, partial [Gemmatimonadaceae bacterium]|nr:glycosyltransferase family 4 protein [Gemmatimonadaceae bacterium]
REEKRESGPLRCLAVGRLIERKGFADVLRAWSLLPRGKYVLEIAGDGPQDSPLRALAGELGLGDDVRFSGALGRDEIAAKCRSADMFVLTPYEEAFGNVFAEAISAGLPVIGSNIGAIPDLVQHGENGILVQPGDAPAVARAVCELGDDAARRAQIATRNRARAESMLSWDTAADKYLALYAELMALGASTHTGAAR